MSTLRLYFRLVMIWLCLLYALPTARTNPSPFYLNATWTNSLSNSDTIIASAFDDSIGVVYMLDSRFVAHRLTYYTLTAYNSRNWSSIVDSGMFPWLEDRRTKNAVLAVNPYSSELFLATYCYSDCKSTLRVHRFFANLTQIGTPAIYEGKDCRICLNGICRLDSVRPPTFFDRQYQNPRIKLYFESGEQLHIALFHDTRDVRSTWLAKIRISHSTLSRQLDVVLQHSAFAIDFGCKNGVVCIWTSPRVVMEYNLQNYSQQSAVTINATSTPVQYDPAIERFGNLTFFLNWLQSGSNQLIVHSKNTTHDSLAAEMLPFRQGFPTQTNIALGMSLGLSLFAGFTTNLTQSSGSRGFDIAISRYDSSLQLLSTTVLSTVGQDNLSSVIPRINNDGFSVVGTTDGSLTQTNATTSRSRVFFVAHFIPFSISNVRPRTVAPGQTIEIRFAPLPLNATVSGSLPRVIFNGQICTNTFWNGSSLNTTVGSGVGGPYELSVIFDYLSFRPSVVNNSILSFHPPIVANVAPSEGPAVGFSVDIEITPIGNMTQSLVVEIGGRTCANVVSVSNRLLRCTLRPGTGRNHSVVVIMGGVRSNGSAVVSYDAPILSQIVPSIGPVAGNNRVNLTGVNFGICSSSTCMPPPNSWVTIGGQLCANLTVFSDSRLSCVAPSGTGSNRTVRLSIDGQESNQLFYTYGRPEISGLVPKSSIQPNPAIYVEGINFGSDSNDISAKFVNVDNSLEYRCPILILNSDSNLLCQFGNQTIPLFAEFDVIITVLGQSSLPSSGSKFYSGIANNPPVAYQFKITTNEDEAAIIHLKGSDPDDGDTVRVFAVNTPQRGDLYYYLPTSINPRGPRIDTSLWPIELPFGQAIYVPAPDFNGEDYFSFIVRDKYNAESSLTYANVSVLPISDRPVASPLNVTITEDNDAILNFTASDPDSPLSTISIIIMTLPSAGQIFELDHEHKPISVIFNVPFELSNKTKSVMYKPPLNSAGIVNGLSFKVRDDTADSLNEAQVTIVIEPVNDAPTASNKTYAILEDSVTTLSFECSDVDVGDSLSVYIETVPPSEAANLFIPGSRFKALVYPSDIVPASLTLELAPNFHGDVSIGYRCSDGLLSSEVAYINVQVANVNDAPTALSRTVVAEEDTETSIQLSVSDFETPDRLWVTILDLPRQGILLAQTNNTDPRNDSWAVITTNMVPYTLPFYRRNLSFRPVADTHGDPYAAFTFRADDEVDESNVATINIKVNPANDPPTINLTSLNILAYEDQEVAITLDIYDVDLNDRLLVKITDISVNGTLFHFDRRTNSRTQLTIGEGSEISGPPYVVVFRPFRDFFSETEESLQKFNVTLADLSGAGSSHRISFSVLPVNDAPIINCVTNSIELPLEFLIKNFTKLNFDIELTDPDDTNVNLVLVNAPRLGHLTADGVILAEGSQFTSTRLNFQSNNSGGGFPYSNFSLYAIDETGAVSNTCTFQFTFTCPPRHYNNIFSNNEGPICSANCPAGSFCSHDGRHSPIPNSGWWKSDYSSAFVPCIPPDACPGSKTLCTEGYEGPRCGRCSKGFYRISGTCKSCDTALPDWLILAGTIGAFVLLGAVSLALKAVPSEGLVNILLNFIQTVALFNQLNFEEYPDLKRLIESFNHVGYLNIEIAAPECILSHHEFIGSLDYRFKFIVMTLLPLILLVIIDAIAVLNTYPFLLIFYRMQRFLTGRDRITSDQLYERQNTMFVNCIQAYNTLLSMLYIIIVNQTVSMFDCSKELDGQYWMDAQPDSLCYQGWWLSYANLGYIALAIYVIGIPFYFCILIFLYYQTLFLGERWMEAREYAERILNVRKSYFKATHQYFIVIQLLRKLSIVLVKVFFTRYLILQAVLSSVILSIDAVLSAKYLPYVLKSLNALEVICTLSAIIIMNGALLIHTDQFERGTAQRDIAAGIIAALIIGCVTVLIIMVIKEIVARIRNWQEADKNSHVFDESILASAQIGGSISRRKLKDTIYLRKILEQAVVATEESTN